MQKIQRMHSSYTRFELYIFLLSTFYKGGLGNLNCSSSGLFSAHLNTYNQNIIHSSNFDNFERNAAYHDNERQRHLCLIFKPIIVVNSVQWCEDL